MLPYLHTRHHEYVDVVTVTVVIAFLSHFFIHDVGVFALFRRCY